MKAARHLATTSLPLYPFDTRCSFLPVFITVEITVHVLIPSFFRCRKHHNCFGVAHLHLVFNGGDLAIDFLRALGVWTNGFTSSEFIARDVQVTHWLNWQEAKTQLKNSMPIYAYVLSYIISYYIRFISGLKHWRNNYSVRSVSGVHTPCNCRQNSRRKGKSWQINILCGISLLCWCGELTYSSVSPHLHFKAL